MKLPFHQAYEKEPFAAFSRSVMSRASVLRLELSVYTTAQACVGPVHSTALRVRTRVHRRGRFHHRTLSSSQSPEKSLCARLLVPLLLTRQNLAPIWKPGGIL